MTSHDVTRAAAEAAPPALVAGAMKLAGVPLPDWVAIMTLIYLAVQTAHLLWRWRRAARKSEAGD